MSAPEIFDYLEGRLTEEQRAELQLRIAAEPALQKDLEAAREIEAGFAALRKVQPPADLLQRTRRQINAGKAVVTESPIIHRTRPFPAWVWPVAASIVVLLAVAAVFQQQQNNRALVAKRDNPERETAAAPEAPLPTAAAAADLGELSKSLDRVAQKNLPTPTLASEQINLSSPAAERSARAEEVIRLAASLGGSALKSEAPVGEDRVLAYIPEDQLESFRRQVERVSNQENLKDASVRRNSGAVVSFAARGADKAGEDDRHETRKKLDEGAENKPAAPAESAPLAPGNRMFFAKQAPAPAAAAAPMLDSDQPSKSLARSAPAPDRPLAPETAKKKQSAPKPTSDPSARTASTFALSPDPERQLGVAEGEGAVKGGKRAPADGLAKAPASLLSAGTLADAASSTGGALRLHASEKSSLEQSKEGLAKEAPQNVVAMSKSKDAPRIRSQIADAKKREAPAPSAKQLIEVIIRTAPGGK